MPEPAKNKQAPASVDLGVVEVEQTEASSEKSAPASIDLGVDPITTPTTTFSGSVSTEGVMLALPGVAQQEEGKMNKKQFFIGFFTPLLVTIILTGVMITTDILSGQGDMETLSRNADGSFTLDLATHGFDCDESYSSLDISWGTDDDSGYANLDCDNSDVLTGSAVAQVGYWYDNGSMLLSLPVTLAPGEQVQLHWYDKGGEGRVTMDGGPRNFSTDLEKRDRCEGLWADFSFIDGGENSWAFLTCKRETSPSQMILRYDVIMADDIDPMEPFNFTLPAGGENAEEVEVIVWTDEEGGGMEDFLPALFCLGFIGATIASFAMGYKWIGYGALASMVAAPAIFVVTCFVVIFTL